MRQDVQEGRIVSAETSLRSYFLTKTAITNLVGERIGTNRLAQGVELPAIVMYRNDSTEEHLLSDLAGAVDARVRVECYADTCDISNSVAKAVKRCGIAAVKGMTHGTDIRGVRVESGQREYDDPPTDGSDESRYVTTFDLMVSYLES
jgi:hypothetical protein